VFVSTEVNEMAYSAKVLADSLSPAGDRLTTMEVTFPRIILAEFNTHRTFSRNSASSRAIPVEKMLLKVKEDPFIPIYWGKNQKGMRADAELLPSEQAWAETEWLEARDKAVKHAEQLLAIGIHKQITNRLLEPWLWQTVIVTATEWENFYALRCNPDAQPEIRKIADMMREVHEASAPKQLDYDDWHLPLIQEEEAFPSDGIKFVELEDIKRISVGRCARVSYLTHDGKRDIKADIDLCTKLQMSGHLSPFEHVARPMTQIDVKEILQKNGIVDLHSLDVESNGIFCGNLKGWISFRKTIPNEDNYSKVPEMRT
jgi:thymidylate synthase ThyX